MSWKTFFKHITPRSIQPTAVAERKRAQLMSSNKVLYGPFTGMTFVWNQWDENFWNPMPKFLGTYELELHETIEKVCNLAPDLIIEVGAADGYYAVGLALRIPNSRVISFEELEKGQKLVDDVAELNGVSARVTSLGRCEVAELEDALVNSSVPFVMMDVEGFEDVLLDLDKIPALAKTHILVEAHDCYVPGLSESIEERFRATHKATKIVSRLRNIDDIKPIDAVTKSYAKYDILGWTEERPFIMNWFYLEPVSVA